MKLSVIIPVYKVEHTLRRCVGSVLAQGLANCEVILVDDGSPDACGEICDSLAKANHGIIKVIHKENGGLSDARNAGLDIATGECIAFADSDDWLAPNTYRPLMDFMEQHPDCDMLEFDAYVLFQSPEQHQLQLGEHSFSDINRYWNETEAYRHTYAWNKIYRRRLFDGVRFPKGVVFEDAHTLPRLLLNAGMICTTDKGLYYYTANENGITATADGNRLKMLLEAHIKAMAMLNDIDMRYFMHVVDIQLDVYRLTGCQLLTRAMMPKGGLAGLDRTKRVKVCIIKLLGMKMLCKIHKLWKNHW